MLMLKQKPLSLSCVYVSDFQFWIFTPKWKLYSLVKRCPWRVLIQPWPTLTPLGLIPQPPRKCDYIMTKHSFTLSTTHWYLLVKKPWYVLSQRPTPFSPGKCFLQFYMNHILPIYQFYASHFASYQSLEIVVIDFTAVYKDLRCALAIDIEWDRKSVV